MEEEVKHAPVILRKKRMIKAIADKTGYYQYEVEDIYNGLIRVMQEELYKGNCISFDGICKFYVEKPKPRWIYNHRNNETYLSSARPRMKFIVSRIIQRALRKHEGPYFINRSETDASTGRVHAKHWGNLANYPEDDTD